MRLLFVLCAFPMLALANCNSPNIEMIFPVAETLVPSAPEASPLDGVTTSFGGQVPVFVGPSKVPQALSLMSGYPAIWHVYLFPGAKVTKIYVFGFDQQKVIVMHSRWNRAKTDPEIVDLSGEPVGEGALSIGPPMSLSGREGENYASVMKRRTGLDVTAFAGIDQLCLNCAFAISMTGHPSDAALNAHFPRAVRRNRRSATGDYKRVRRDLSLLVDRGVLPAQMPLFEEDGGRKDSEVRHWSLLPDEAPTPYHSRHDDCGRIALGTPSDDAMWCNAHQGDDAATTWIIAGKGHDVIGVDDDLSQVLSGGRGDDIIGAGFGNDVIYFGRAWGDDLVSMRCLSRWDDSPLPAYQDSRYVVFGRGVRPKNLRWLNDREIEDVSTGSRIRFADELCRARFIAVEPGSIPERPDSEPGS